ncbi:MAG: alpha-amylase family glycosyl hydrolase [Flavobacteriales bacterium]|nr:alpha-amylase family glycosyl hydrolase [Flavobacteriales bacterium]
MKKLLSPLLAISIFTACESPKPPIVEIPSKSESNWSANSTIYEVNLRQMTEDGTFKAFQEQHLDRLADMGIEILWFMPIYPIGEKNRKGTLGSYYAVKDYQAVNPEHGTMEDFKELVDAAHSKGMKVILDWVANHTAWDNAWVTEHPEWYTTDSTGKMVPPVADWADVVDLNYDDTEMREAMIESLEFWLREADVDGYRCDVAEMVPLDFWVDARARIDAVKPNFFLAEGEAAELHEAFDMTYAWSFHHLMNEIARGEKGASDVKVYWEEHKSKYKSEDYRMQFITNHDENSWNGTAIERMGDNRNSFAVMSFTVPGMPLIYSGQEADMDKRLEFFEKDVIDWSDDSLVDFYKKLILIKSVSPVLLNGPTGGAIDFLDVGEENILVYTRSTEESEMLIALNFSDDETRVKVKDLSGDTYISLLDSIIISRFENILPLRIPANGYQVFSRYDQ